MSDVVVIGAGVSGIAAALRLREQGLSVTLATFGTGGLPLSTGCLDVLGYVDGARVERPLDQLSALGEGHPYATIGTEAVKAGVEAFVSWCGPELLSTPDWTNHSVPTALGVLRPTCVVQPSMTAGDLTPGSKALVVGIDRFKDFHADLVAGNLAKVLGSENVRHVEVSYTARTGEADPSGLAIANSLDIPANRTELAKAVSAHVQPGEVVVIPAVLGNHDHATHARFSEQIGAPLVEVPCLPPSVPGIRLNDHLVTKIKKDRIRWILGSHVTAGAIVDGRLRSVTLASTGSPKELVANHFVLATGGFESGGLEMDSYGTVRETVLDMPVWKPSEPLVHGDYLGREQPLFRCGLRTDDHMRPVDEAGHLVADNLYATGGLLAGAMRWSEHSGEGIALGSAWKATDHILSSTGRTEDTL